MQRISAVAGVARDAGSGREGRGIQGIASGEASGRNPHIAHKAVVLRLQRQISGGEADGVDCVRVASILQQLQKLHDVREVEVLDSKDTVIRELLLIKVRNKTEIRQDIMTAVEILRSKIVDYSTTALICELTGETSKIDAFIELMKTYGIMEMCRTGMVAIERGENCLKTK